MPLEQPVRLALVAGDLHHLGELPLGLVVARARPRCGVWSAALESVLLDVRSAGAPEAERPEEEQREACDRHSERRPPCRGEQRRSGQLVGDDTVQSFALCGAPVQAAGMPRDDRRWSSCPSTHPRRRAARSACRCGCPKGAPSCCGLRLSTSTLPVVRVDDRDIDPVCDSERLLLERRDRHFEVDDRACLPSGSREWRRVRDHPGLRVGRDVGLRLVDLARRQRERRREERVLRLVRREVGKRSSDAVRRSGRFPGRCGR